MGSIVSSVANIAGGFFSSQAQSRAAASATGAQIDAAYAGIDEQRRQFDLLQELLKPFIEAGTGALGQQQEMLGLKGAGAQQAAMTELEQSPFYQGLVSQGENALLQQASATGGLRGGNLQAALAQFRPNMLSQAFADKYNRLAGLTSIGQASATNTGAQAMQLGSNVAGLLGDVGQAAATGSLAKGKILSNTFQSAGNFGEGFGQGLSQVLGF
jgi:hypothetical protein